MYDHADLLVIFGITGDRARRMTFSDTGPSAGMDRTATPWVA
jgi:hypothetical protein